MPWQRDLPDVGQSYAGEALADERHADIAQRWRRQQPQPCQQLLWHGGLDLQEVSAAEQLLENTCAV